jgi:hypothetical protein
MDQQPHLQATTDLSGLLILLNFVVILWFGYVALHGAVQKGGEISLNAKLIGLGSAFATCLELYSYALKSGQPEWVVYALAILFYVFFVPFFLTRRLNAPAAGPEDISTAVHALAAYELVVYALVVGAATAFVCSIYFVVLNDGLVLFGYEAVRPVVKLFAQHGRTEFWGINPAVLGIGWLAAVFVSSTASPPAGGEFGLDHSGA